MRLAEYYDSIASFWDDDFSEAKPKRVIASSVSIPNGGACVLDIGCGNGALFPDLTEAGACEIDGVDISGKMVEAAQEKYGYDPRIHVVQADFLSWVQPGYDVLIAFNSYHHFLHPRRFLQKAKELLRPNGRLTVSFSFDREHMNALSAILPAGLARGLLPAQAEADYWREFFEVDCICDNDSLYLISGIVKERRT